MFQRCGFRQVDAQERDGARAVVLEPAPAGRERR